MTTAFAGIDQRTANNHQSEYQQKAPLHFVVVAKVLMSSTMLPRPRSKTESPDLLTITRYIDGMRRESVERWLVECVRACRTHPETTEMRPSLAGEIY